MINQSLKVLIINILVNLVIVHIYTQLKAGHVLPFNGVVVLLWCGKHQVVKTPLAQSYSISGGFFC